MGSLDAQVVLQGIHRTGRATLRTNLCLGGKTQYTSPPARPPYPLPTHLPAWGSRGRRPDRTRWPKSRFHSESPGLPWPQLPVDGCVCRGVPAVSAMYMHTAHPRARYVCLKEWVLERRQSYRWGKAVAWALANIRTACSGFFFVHEFQPGAGRLTSGGPPLFVQ
eukprot:1159257-Pelagomonas_calceolata.AAC.2